jgi:c-di-GMP-binding flagellar brake protein YcgR
MGPLAEVRLNANRMMRSGDGSGRRSPRLSIRLAGALKGRQPREVQLLDLSATGCLARAPSPLDTGAIFDLELQLVAAPWCAKVRVSSCALDGETTPDEASRYLVGLEFLALPAQESDVLRRFLADEQRRRIADPPAH